MGRRFHQSNTLETTSPQAAFAGLGLFHRSVDSPGRKREMRKRPTRRRHEKADQDSKLVCTPGRLSVLPGNPNPEGGF